MFFFFCVDFFFFLHHERHISHLRWRTSSRKLLCGVFYANAGGYSSCILHSHGHSISLNGGSKLCLLWLDLCCLCVQSQISSLLHLAYKGKPKKGDTFAHLYLQSKYFKSNKRDCILTHSHHSCPAQKFLQKVRKGWAGYCFAEVNMSAKMSWSKLITRIKKHWCAPVLFRLLWSALHAQTCAQRICTEGSNGISNVCHCQHMFLQVNETQGHA